MRQSVSKRILSIVYVIGLTVAWAGGEASNMWVLKVRAQMLCLYWDKLTAHLCVTPFNSYWSREKFISTAVEKDLTLADMTLANSSVFGSSCHCNQYLLSNTPKVSQIILSDSAVTPTRSLSKLLQITRSNKNLWTRIPATRDRNAASGEL